MKKEKSIEEKYQELINGLPTYDEDTVRMFLKKHQLDDTWIEILMNHFYPEFWKGCGDNLLLATHNPEIKFLSKYLFVIICGWFKDNYIYYQNVDSPVNGMSHEAYKEQYR